MPTNRNRITINLTDAETAALLPHQEAVRGRLGREQLSLAAFIHITLSEHYKLGWPIPERGNPHSKPTKKRNRR